MKHLVIGNGEIGSAIAEVLEADVIDKDERAENEEYEFIHICFPYSESFIEIVEDYQREYNPRFTVIHATVPVGVSKICNAVHSPVRGRHPNLEPGVRTFTKFFGGEGASVCAREFEELGIETVVTPNSEDTEAMKLWDTTIYGVNIQLEKLIYKYCKMNGLDFDIVYTKANETYNQGYEDLGEPQFKKYVLKHNEGPIGGHCVLQNLPLLDEQKVDAFFDVLK